MSPVGSGYLENQGFSLTLDLNPILTSIDDEFYSLTSSVLGGISSAMFEVFSMSNDIAYWFLLIRVTSRLGLSLLTRIRFTALSL